MPHGYVVVMAHDTNLAALTTAIDDTAAMLLRELGAIEETLPELRRLARAAPSRRNRDATRYALGGALTVLGLEHFDPTALAGLFGNPEQMLTWLTAARATNGPAPLAKLIGKVFEDEARFAWCRQWGVHIGWHHGKALYDATVISFVSSGRTGPKERWRRDAITDDQANLILRICTLRLIEEPQLATRGEAFDWIFEQGGKPSWWATPATPSAWSL